MLMLISYGRSFLFSNVRVSHKLKSTIYTAASALHTTTATTTTTIESEGKLLLCHHRIIASII